MPSDKDAIDSLSEYEFDVICRGDEMVALKMGRARAWAQRRASGPTGKLKDLACGALGDSVLLEGYISSQQVSALVRNVSLAEGIQFTSRVERSLVNGEIIGVRVTLAAFTR